MPSHAAILPPIALPTAALFSAALFAAALFAVTLLTVATSTIWKICLLISISFLSSHDHIVPRYYLST